MKIWTAEPDGTRKWQVESIPEDIAIEFLKDNNAKKDYVYIRHNDEWFGIFAEGELACVAGVTEKSGYMSIGSAYTLPEYRRKHMLLTMVTEIMEGYPPETTWIHWARPDSAKMYEKYCGFECRQILKNGTKKMVRKGETA